MFYSTAQATKNVGHVPDPPNPLQFITRQLRQIAVAPVINHEDEGRQRPSDGVGPEDDANVGDKADHDGDVGNPDDAPGEEHDEHGDFGFAEAAEDAGQEVGEGEEEEEEGDDAGSFDSDGDDLGLGVEDADELGREDPDQDADEFGEDDAGDNAEARPFADAVVLFGTQVLTNEGGEGHTEAGNRQEGEPFEFGVGAGAGHGHRTERIDVGLDDDVGKGNDRVLDTAGDAHLEE